MSWLFSQLRAPAGVERDLVGSSAGVSWVARMYAETPVSGYWTKDISKAHALAKKIRAGSIYINCYNVFDAALPFGGYKQSGWGREMGHEVLNNYTEVKAVTTLL
jgi:acyl-CoA reductase-like NAD-dependent aldehyde dehydrogenase